MNEDEKKSCECCKKTFSFGSLTSNAGIYPNPNKNTSSSAKLLVCESCFKLHAKFMDKKSSTDKQYSKLLSEHAELENRQISADSKLHVSAEVSDEASKRAMFDTVSNWGVSYSTDPQIQHNKNYTEIDYSEKLAESIESQRNVDNKLEEILKLELEFTNQFLNEFNNPPSSNSQNTQNMKSLDEVENQTPINILKKRLALGEITKEEFEDIKRVLE